MPAVHFPAHLTLSVVDWNTTLCALNKHDASKNGRHHHKQEQSHKDAHVACLDKLYRLEDATGDTGDNAREDDQRDTVANTLLSDLFTKPHDEHSARGQGDNGYAPESPTSFENHWSPRGAVHTFKAHGDAEALNDSNEHCGVTSILRQLSTPCGTLFFCHPL